MTDSVRTLETLEIVAGELCLNFVNTINSRVHREHDYLVQYSDVVDWANKVGILSPAQRDQLHKRAQQNMEEAEHALQSTLDLRELLYRLFSNAARGSEPSKNDIDTFILYYGRSIADGQLLKKDNRYLLDWNVDQAFDSLLSPILHSAGELLLYGDLNQVKECPGCGWLFLDTSKNQSRRWCSMNTCGARDKMRRYYKRKQAK